MSGNRVEEELAGIIGPPRNLYNKRVPDSHYFFGRESTVSDLQIRLQEKKKVFVYVLNSYHFVLRLTILFVYPKAKSRPK